MSAVFFLLRDAMLARCMLIALCVCLSVAGHCVLSELLNVL